MPDPVEVVAAIYAAWNTGEEWGLEYFHPEVEWESVGPGAFELDGTMHGRDSLLAYWRHFWGAWRPGARWEIEELLSLPDDRVLACGWMRAVGRTSGAEVKSDVAQLWTVRDGLVVRLLIGEDR